jgi:hypothetical protein
MRFPPTSAPNRKVLDESAAFGNQDTSDVFTEFSCDVDHQLWLVESHLYR